MSYFNVDNAVFNEHLRMLETTDRNHADVFNELFGQLIENDVALKEAATSFAGTKNERKRNHALVGDFCSVIWKWCATYDLGCLYSSMAAERVL